MQGRNFISRLLAALAFIVALGAQPVLAQSRSIHITPQEVKNAYEVLGFGDRGSNASFEEIHEKVKQLLLKNHPDRGGDTKKAAEISGAWTIIQNARQRHLDWTPGESISSSASQPGSGFTDRASAERAFGSGVTLWEGLVMEVFQVFESEDGYVFRANVHGQTKYSDWFWKPKDRPLISRILTTGGEVGLTVGRKYMKLETSLYDPRLPSGRIAMNIQEGSHSLTIGHSEFFERPVIGQAEWNQRLAPEGTVFQYNRMLSEGWRTYDYYVYDAGADGYYVLADPENYYGESFNSYNQEFRMFVVAKDFSSVQEFDIGYDRRHRTLTAPTGHRIIFSHGFAVKEKPIFDEVTGFYFGRFKIQDQDSNMQILSGDKREVLLGPLPAVSEAEINKMSLIKLLGDHVSFPPVLSTPLDSMFENRTNPGPQTGCRARLLLGPAKGGEGLVPGK